MLALTCRSLRLLSRFDTVEADGWPRERRNRRLVVSFAALDLDHLRASQCLVLIQPELVLLLP